MGIFSKLFGERATPLHRAAGVGDTREVARLIVAGADPNVKNLYDETPLIWASRGAHVEVAFH